MLQWPRRKLTRPPTLNLVTCVSNTLGSRRFASATLRDDRTYQRAGQSFSLGRRGRARSGGAALQRLRGLLAGARSRRAACRYYPVDKIRDRNTFREGRLMFILTGQT